jgi:hypothetical protein
VRAVALSSVDEKLGLVPARSSSRSGYGTFGQAYRKPASVDTCNAAAPTGFTESCEQEGEFWKSIVAFDLETGAPVWSHRSAWSPKRPSHERRDVIRDAADVEGERHSALHRRRRRIRRGACPECRRAGGAVASDAIDFGGDYLIEVHG